MLNSSSRNSNNPPRQKSCHECFKSKRRCNRSFPTCSRCSRQKLECSYIAPPTLSDEQNSIELVVPESFNYCLPDGEFSGLDSSSTMRLFDADLTSNPNAIGVGLGEVEEPDIESPSSIQHGQCKELEYTSTDAALDLILKRSHLSLDSNAAEASARLHYALTAIISAPSKVVLETQTPWMHSLLYNDYMPRPISGRSHSVRVGFTLIIRSR